MSLNNMNIDTSLVDTGALRAKIFILIFKIQICLHVQTNSLPSIMTPLEKEYVTGKVSKLWILNGDYKSHDGEGKVLATIFDGTCILFNGEYKFR